MLVIPNILKRSVKSGSVNHWLSIRQQSTKSLPLKLPVPSLDQTLEKYLRYVKPLISENEFNHTNELIGRFAHGEGQILQKLLTEKADKCDNWLSDWWKMVAYLDSREPIVISSNPGLRLPVRKFKNTDDWLHFSASILSSLLKYKYLIDHNKVPQEYHKQDPLCMNQYYALFSSCRIPGRRSDDLYSVQTHLLPPDERPTYVIVVHRNRFFLMDVIDRKTQKTYSKEAIVRGLYKVIEFSQTKGQPLGLMTAENRNVWGTSYARLQEMPKNREAFKMMQNSLLILCLDHGALGQEGENPDSLVARNVLHGGGHKLNSANRWFDKTLQVIVSSDGACGMNYEHTTAEAPPLIAMVDYAFKDLATETGESGNAYFAEVCPVTELEFSLDTRTRQDIDVAKTNISSLVNDLELHAASFPEVGKTVIKAHKVSPDAFVQLGLQLAYHQLHGQPGSTYESGSLRRFIHGRTDTIRTCSPEAVLFCKAVSDPAISDTEKKRLLIAAVEQNSSYTKDVLYGQGIDRHLLGLKMIAVENNRNVPEVFMDTSYRKAMHHVLSTSQGAANTDLTMCYGPLVPDGYGCCYNVKPEKVLASVSAVNSSPNTSAAGLAREMGRAFSRMLEVLGAPGGR